MMEGRTLKIWAPRHWKIRPPFSRQAPDIRHSDIVKGDRFSNTDMSLSLMMIVMNSKGKRVRIILKMKVLTSRMISIWDKTKAKEIRIDVELF